MTLGPPPDRAFASAGDAGCGTHAVARFRSRHRSELTLMGKCHPGVDLFDPPSPHADKRRSRAQGRRVIKPRQAAGAKLSPPRVRWYRGGTRRVEAATGTGHRDEGGGGLVPLGKSR